MGARNHIFNLEKSGPGKSAPNLPANRLVGDGFYADFVLRRGGELHKESGFID